jgi:hypothetical protein
VLASPIGQLLLCDGTVGSRSAGVVRRDPVQLGELGPLEDGVDVAGPVLPGEGFDGADRGHHPGPNRLLAVLAALGRHPGDVADRHLARRLRGRGARTQLQYAEAGLEHGGKTTAGFAGLVRNPLHGVRGAAPHRVVRRTSRGAQDVGDRALHRDGRLVAAARTPGEPGLGE